MSTKFQKFLDDKAQPGRFDSSGEFMLAGAKALEKLAAHSVTNLSHWVLKIVQAAVSVGSTEVRFFHFTRATRAEIVMSSLPSAEMLLEALLELEHGNNTFLTELCTGLRPLLRNDSLRICWMQPEVQTGLQWDGSQFQAIESSPDTQTETFLRIEFPVAFFSSAIRAEETVLLNQRCRWCPIPLKLDGRTINVVSNVRGSDFEPGDHGKDSPRLLASGWFDSSKGEDLSARSKPVKAEVGSWTDQLRADLAFLHWPKPETSSLQLGGFSLYCSYSFKSYELTDLLFNQGKRTVIQIPESMHVSATRYGVICANLTRREFGVGGEFVFPADDQKSDITGLNLTLSRAWCEKLKPKFHSLSNILNTTRTAVSAHQTPLTPADILEKFSYFGYGLGAGLVTAVVGVASGGIVSLAAPFMPFFFLGSSKRDAPEVLEALPDWLQEASGKIKNFNHFENWAITMGELRT